MDRRQAVTAASVINGATVDELAGIFWELGGERQARRFARAVVREREHRSFETTRQLAALIETLAPRHGRKTHPATKVFQAIRMAVNDEIGSLQRGLAGALEVLKPGGRLAVITFQSLEDRIVKEFGRVRRPGLHVCRDGRCAGIARALHARPQVGAAQGDPATRGRSGGKPAKPKRAAASDGKGLRAVTGDRWQVLEYRQRSQIEKKMARNRKYQSAAIRFGPALKAFLLCLLIGGSGVGYVWQKDQVSQLGQQIKKREAQLKGLVYQNEKLRKQLGEMRSPASLEKSHSAPGPGSGAAAADAGLVLSRACAGFTAAGR